MLSLALHARRNTGDRMNKSNSKSSRAAAALRDLSFQLACRVLLPIATSCKVCNMLRGAAIGFVCGAVAVGLVIYASLPFIGGC